MHGLRVTTARMNGKDVREQYVANMTRRSRTIALMQRCACVRARVFEREILNSDGEAAAE